MGDIIQTGMGGYVRGAQNIVTPPGTPNQTPHLNERADFLMAQALPERAELVKMGGSWHASIPTGSVFTTVAGWPTTRAELVMSNGNQAGGVSFVIDYVWGATIVTETAASFLTLIGQISPAGAVAVAADNAAVLRVSQSGKAAAYGGNAKFALANTAFAVASKWQVLPNQVGGLGPGAVSIGQYSTAQVNGLLVVQPQATLCLNVVVGTAVASAAMLGVVWHEVQLALGG